MLRAFQRWVHQCAENVHMNSCTAFFGIEAVTQTDRQGGLAFAEIEYRLRFA